MQRLELTWIGKGEEVRVEPRILLHDASKDYGDPAADNMLIHGDNLMALKALEQEFTGRVKCIYIDPPYNINAAQDVYDDNVEHSTWLSLIKPRLQLLWSLLHKDEGSFWISIDDYEMPYLRVLLDEVCGRNCFVACNVWQKRYSRENREAIGDVHEYIVVYAKNPLFFKTIRNKLPPTSAQQKVYRNPNNDPKGPWRPIPMTAQEGHATPEQFYEITAPSGRVFTPPQGRCWGLSQATFQKFLNEGRVYFGKFGDSQPNIIRYLSEVEGVTPWTWWPNEEVGHTDEAKKEIHGLFGKKNAFPTPKPERLIERILTIASNEGDLVLDSFMGSGTTAAVAHKMKRQYIGIELYDHCYSLCLPRLRGVVDGELGGISRSVNWKGGGGFKFYELAPTLIVNDKYGNPVISDNYKAEMLVAAVAKLNGFVYAPETECFWKQGKAQGSSYIYVTTQYLTARELDDIAREVADFETLVICAPAFDVGLGKRYDNITIKKIPQSVLSKCEYGMDNYNLNVVDVSEFEEDDYGEFESEC